MKRSTFYDWDPLSRRELIEEISCRGRDNSGSVQEVDIVVKECVEKLEDEVAECLGEGVSQALGSILESPNELDADSLKCSPTIKISTKEYRVKLQFKLILIYPDSLEHRTLIRRWIHLEPRSMTLEVAVSIPMSQPFYTMGLQWHIFSTVDHEFVTLA
ncbi:hypothetical protein TNCV_4721341 [Trichonephila clavipes]|uniref:Uncharacterized protein n=1 Tax=Trichonephila clavipes TaxID=2585209 RepID=A0A8X6W7B2_TRICX|nr:hypothetical protein TNCV_4721341 [Trichonephila clavipes]